MDTTPATIAFLGSGAMGEALLAGSLDGGLDPSGVWVTARGQEHVDHLANRYGVRGTTDNAEAVADARIVVLALPPERTLGVVAEIGGHLRADAVVVSLADGVSLADLAGALPAGTTVARAMPSLAAQVGEGLTLLAVGDACADDQRDAVTALLARSGEVVPVDEEQIGVLAPLSSGGPAYLFYVADAMIEAAAMRGIPRTTAQRLVATAMAGAAAWLHEGSQDAAALRAKVCAPGGAGIRRIAELDERAVRAAFVAALTRSP